MSDCLCFSKCWAICVSQLFVNQAVTSSSLKLTLFFLSSLFDTWPKIQDKNLTILKTKRAFLPKIKSIFHHFYKGFSCENCLKPETAPLIMIRFSCNDEVGSHKSRANAVVVLKDTDILMLCRHSTCAMSKACVTKMKNKTIYDKNSYANIGTICRYISYTPSRSTLQYYPIIGCDSALFF